MGFLDRVGRFVEDVLLLPEETRSQLEAAEQALLDEIYDGAEDLFRGVLEDRPALVRAHLGLVEACQAQGKWQSASESALKALELSGGQPEVALLAARVHLRAGRPEQAARAARLAVRRVPQTDEAALAEASLLSAETEMALHRPDRATRDLRRLAALASLSFDRRVRGVQLAAEAAHRGVTQAQGVLSVLLAECKPESMSKEALREVGLALRLARRHEAAVSFLDHAADAGDAKAALARAEMALEGSAQASSDAVLWARKAVGLGGGHAALWALGRALAWADEVDEALDVLALLLDDAAFYTRAAHQMLHVLRTTPSDAASAVLGALCAPRAVAENDAAAAKERERVHEVARVWTRFFERANEAQEREGEGTTDGEPHAEAPAFDESTATAPVSHASTREPLSAALERLSRPDARGSQVPRLFILRAIDALERHDPVSALFALDEYAETALQSLKTPPSLLAAVAELRKRALRDQWRGPLGTMALAPALESVARMAQAHALQALAAQAERLRDELDRPLLLAVMGEFNAGKSTLINAFVGADVAPTGVVPTTATLNILRYGTDRRVRMVMTDGTMREGAYEDLEHFLSKQDPLGVDQVEILLPSPMLDRVWILDSPGTNSLTAAHAELAREGARRADAVLWVFNAAQAGKQTEQALLDELARDHRTVVPVLNKVDRLTDEERTRVTAWLRDTLGEPLCVSAKQATKARRDGDTTALETSGWSAFMHAMDAQIFSRSGVLKQRAVAGRMLEALQIAVEAEEARLVSPTESAEALERQVDAMDHLVRTLTNAAREVEAELERALVTAFDRAATEILELVQPRRTLLEEHSVDIEDRALIHDLLLRELGGPVVRAEAELFARAQVVLQAWLDDIGTLGAVSPDHLLRLHIARAFAEFHGVQRGLLRGDGWRHFFEVELGRTSLSHAQVAQALSRLRAPVAELLRAKLNESLGAFASVLDQQRVARANELRRGCTERAQRVLQPLHALREVLAEIRGTGSNA